MLLSYVGTKKDPLLDTCFGVAPFLEGELVRLASQQRADT